MSQEAASENALLGPGLERLVVPGFPIRTPDIPLPNLANRQQHVVVVIVVVVPCSWFHFFAPHHLLLEWPAGSSHLEVDALVRVHDRRRGTVTKVIVDKTKNERDPHREKCLG